MPPSLLKAYVVGTLDTKGVEFGPWVRRFIAQVKSNWLIPYAAMSSKGHVVITFNVHKNGSITDLTIRRLLTLQGAMKPDEIVSLMSYKGQNSTLALPDHKDRLQVEYTPLFGNNKKLSQQIAGILQPGQWVKLIQRIGQIPEPVVPVTPSQYAIKPGG